MVFLDDLADEVVKNIQKNIKNLTEPPLSPVTIMIRRLKKLKQFKNASNTELLHEANKRLKMGEGYGNTRTKPLIDTGLMLQSVTWKYIK